MAPERLGVDYEKRPGGEVLLRVSGRLEQATAPLLSGVLQWITGEASRVVLDLTAVDHIDSHGLDVLLDVDAAAAGRSTAVEVVGIQESLLARRSPLDERD